MRNGPEQCSRSHGTQVDIHVVNADLIADVKEP